MFLYVVKVLCFIVFFFSSRRRHTRLPRDWSSDVCSSDLSLVPFGGPYWSGFLSIKFHRAKLGKNEGATVFADAFLLEKNWSTRIDFNQNRRQHYERQRKKHAHQSHQSVYGVANNSTQPGLATSPGEDQPRRAHHIQ